MRDASRRARLWARSRGGLVALATVAALLAGGELFFRANRERFGVERSRLWELRSFVCYGSGRFVPKASVGWVFNNSRQEVAENGFIGPDFERERRPGVPRIACLGGSTTAGNLYEGYGGSYPGALAEVLGERLERQVEVMNFGVAGWTSAESLVNWMLLAQDFDPDVVLIHHAINDVFPRLAEGFRGDYSHYTHAWRPKTFSFFHRFMTRWSDFYAWKQLARSGFRLTDHVSVSKEELGERLDPGTSRPFERNVGALAASVRALGAVPVLVTMPWFEGAQHRLASVCILGMSEHNEIARRLAEDEGYALFDMARVEDPDLSSAYIDLVHLTPDGNRRKAEHVAAFLVENALIPLH